MENYKQIMDDLAQRFGIVIDWTSNNMKPILEQLYHEIVCYGMVSSWVTVIITTIIVGVFIKLIRCIYKTYQACVHNDYKADGFWFEDGIGLTLSLPSILVFGFGILTTSIAAMLGFMAIRKLIVLYSAPSLYVFEYITAICR